MKRGKHGKLWHLFAGIACFAVAIAVVMCLWNAIIPGVTGWGGISYMQAAGLFLLTRILFGGHGPGRLGHWHDRWHDRREHARMHEEMHGMSLSQKREYIRKRMCEMHQGEEQDGKRPSDPYTGDEQPGA